MSLTADFVATIRGMDPDPTARREAARLVADGLAVAALGAGEEGPARLAALAPPPREGEARASLIGRGRGGTPADAARINAAAMHVLDFEPMWQPATHALSPVLPALLALAEAGLAEGAEGAGPTGRGPALAGPGPAQRGGDPGAGPAARSAPMGRRLLDALVAGIEAQGRLRRASGQFEPRDLAFHPPGVVGPIGSAIACGLLIGLDDPALVHAVGIAASRAGGILANVGSMTKALHCGDAAAAGLEAARLAAAGFTADPDALAGPRGFCAAFFEPGHDPAALTAPAPAWILAPGPAWKLYPSQYGTHFVIEAALEARARLPAGAWPERVAVHGPSMPYVDRPAPASGLAGKFSFQYVAAAALLDGRVDLDSFSDRRRFAPDMVAMLPRIVIRPDPGREGRFDRMRVEVEVTAADGARAIGRCDGPPGIWGRPVPPARLRAKAQDCLTRAADAATAEAVLALCDRFEELDAAGIGRLMARLREAAPRRSAA